MRDEVAPSLLGPFSVVAIVQDGGGEGSSDGEEDEPVAGWELEAKVGHSYVLSERPGGQRNSHASSPIMRKTGLPVGLGCGVGRTSLAALSTGAGGLSVMIGLREAVKAQLSSYLQLVLSVVLFAGMIKNFLFPNRGWWLKRGWR